MKKKNILLNINKSLKSSLVGGSNSGTSESLTTKSILSKVITPKN